MNYITLISDWEQQDPYLAMFKGQIYKMIPDPVIFDITHSVEVLNLNKTAFILKNAFNAFPEKSVHLILTGISYSLRENPVVAQYQNHFFIGNDSGIFSLLFFGSEEAPELLQYSGEETDFLTKMLILAKGCFQNTLGECTVPFVSSKIKLPFEPCLIRENHISGQIVFVDSHHNIITNIPVEMFLKANKTGKFYAELASYHITRYHENYVSDTEPYFLPNSFGVLEIATYKGRLSIISNWQQDLSIDIDFY